MTLAILLGTLLGISLMCIPLTIPLEKSEDHKKVKLSNKILFTSALICITCAILLGIHIKWVSNYNGETEKIEEIKIYNITSVDANYIQLGNETSIRYNDTDMTNVELKLSTDEYNNLAVYIYTEETLPSTLGIKNIRGRYRYEVYLEEDLYEDINNIIEYKNFKWVNDKEQ